MKKSYRVFIFLIMIVLILSYQQCSNVTLQQEAALTSLVPNKLAGRFCSLSDRANDTLYSLEDFYIINLTTRSLNGRLVADSNLNGLVTDLSDPTAAEEDLNLVPTVTLSSLDSDSDGVPDFVEKLKGLNPFRNDLDEDGYDLDGLTNKKELQLGTDPESQKITPEIKYTIKESLNTLDCGPGQSAYSFEVTQIPSIANQEFKDPINTHPEFNLSHLKNENIYLILINLQPENSVNKRQTLFKLFKHDAFVDFNFEFSPKDFINIINLKSNQ